MNNRTKGISLAIITAVMWGIMGMFVRGLTGTCLNPSISSGSL